MADPIHSKGGRPLWGDPARASEEVESKEKVEAVAALLNAKRALLDRPPTPAEIPLPKLSRSVEGATRLSMTRTASPPGIDGRSASLDPTRVDLPGVSPADGRQDSGQSQVEGNRPGMTAEDRPTPSLSPTVDLSSSRGVIPPAPYPSRAIAASVRPSTIDGGTSADRPALAEAAEVVSGRAADTSRPEKASSPEVGIPASMTVHISSGGPLVSRPVSEFPTPSDLRSDVGVATQPAPIPSGKVKPIPDHAGGYAPTQVAARSREASGVIANRGNWDVAGREVPASKDSQHGALADSPTNSMVEVGDSMTFVRNPRSSDLGNLAQANPANLSQGSSTSDGGRIGSSPGEGAPGVATSSTAGTSVDLSRTNELLQQLIDAVRKQKGSSLPPGGASVYADR